MRCSLVRGFEPFIAKSGLSCCVNIFRVKRQLSESLHNAFYLCNVFFRCLLFTGIIYCRFSFCMVWSQAHTVVLLPNRGDLCGGDLVLLIRGRFGSQLCSAVYCADVRGLRASTVMGATGCNSNPVNVRPSYSS